jgi:DNA-binding NtrC family response regulator
MSNAALPVPAFTERSRRPSGSSVPRAHSLPFPDRHIHAVVRDERTTEAAIMRVLVVTEDQDVLVPLRKMLTEQGRDVLHSPRVTGVLEFIDKAEVDLVIADQQFSDGNGLTLLEQMRKAHPNVLTALLTATGSQYSAIQAFERGAMDSLPKPIERDETLAFLRRVDSMKTIREPAAASSEPASETPSQDFRGMYGATQVMRDTFKMISRVGRTDVTVLVTGESGTGKELVARALHEESGRRNKPFIALNCSALPSELVESELFGHTRGAFTGAVKDRGGLFEAANGGTLFLDEIGDLGPLAQAKVLRALENGEVMRVGGTRSTRVDVRVIAATNRPLDDMILDGRFREDLLYRLKVITLNLPPLRERKEDVPLLANHFLQVFAERHNLPARKISEDAKRLLLEHDWPGNVRELRNVIEGALVMADGSEIEACDLPASVTQQRRDPVSVPAMMLEQTADMPFVEARERALREFDRAFLSAALARNGGNIARTARALGLHRQSLQKLLARRDLRQAGDVKEA